jgi:hypothetical protein
MRHTTPKTKLKAVHDEDLENFIDRLGILKKFKSGEIKCKFCEAPITFENLHSLFPQSGAIKFVCDSSDCVRKLQAMLREGLVSL